MHAVSTIHDEYQALIPALLRKSWHAYGNAIRNELLVGGFDDMPQNGPYVLGALFDGASSATELILGLGVTKQATSQLVDTLVLRGYLERATNADDKRRMDIRLTNRGRAAAAAVRAAIEETDATLARLISPAQLAGLRAGLDALSHISEFVKDTAGSRGVGDWSIDPSSVMRAEI